MWLDQLITGIVYLLSSMVVFLVGHKAFSMCRKGYDIQNELVEKDNAAFALTLCGYYLGLIFAIGGVVSGPSHGLTEDLIDMAVYGLLAILLLNISAMINDRFILSEFQIHKEILEDQNCGTGVVEFAVFVASGLNIFGAVSGEGGDITTALGFWAAGQLVLIVIARYYNMMTSYDVHEHIEKDNVAVGVGFAGAILAVGNLLRAASAGDFVSWQENMLEFAGFLAIALVLLPAMRAVTDRILLPGRSLADELVNQEKPNLGAAFMEAASYVGASFLITWCV